MLDPSGHDDQALYLQCNYVPFSLKMAEDGTARIDVVINKVIFGDGTTRNMKLKQTFGVPTKAVE